MPRRALVPTLLRYRGYYYDEETGFYYLQSRYYDPKIGRFINADNASMLGASGSILGYNLFAYCENNPINMQDSTGNLLAQALWGAAFSAVTTWLLYLVEYKLGMRNWNWGTLAYQVAVNAAMGAIQGIFFGGPFAKLFKLAGLAQKAGLSGTALKAIKLVTKGTSVFVNMIIKPMTRKPGESWFAAVRRLFS